MPRQPSLFFCRTYSLRPMRCRGLGIPSDQEKRWPPGRCCPALAITQRDENRTLAFADYGRWPKGWLFPAPVRASICTQSHVVLEEQSAFHETILGPGRSPLFGFTHRPTGRGCRPATRATSVTLSTPAFSRAFLFAEWARLLVFFFALIRREPMVLPLRRVGSRNS